MDWFLQDRNIGLKWIKKYQKRFCINFQFDTNDKMVNNKCLTAI